VDELIKNVQSTKDAFEGLDDGLVHAPTLQETRSVQLLELKRNKEGNKKWFTRLVHLASKSNGALKLPIIVNNKEQQEEERIEKTRRKKLHRRIDLSSRILDFIPSKNTSYDNTNDAPLEIYSVLEVANHNNGKERNFIKIMPPEKEIVNKRKMIRIKKVLNLEPKTAKNLIVEEPIKTKKVLRLKKLSPNKTILTPKPSNPQTIVNRTKKLTKIELPAEKPLRETPTLRFNYGNKISLS